MFIVIVHQRDCLTFPNVHNWSFTKVARGLFIQSHFLLFALALHRRPLRRSLTFGDQVVQQLARESSIGIGCEIADAGPIEASGVISAPVEEGRRHLVEAAIVTIMKARKNLHHNDLTAIGTN